MGNLSALANNVVQTTPVGVIEAFAGVNAPAGWLFCDGSAVSRIQYPELFSALGTTYGSGDGSTTFNLPDLRGRVPAGKDNMGGVAANRLTSGNSGIAATSLGAVGGDERLHQHTHTQNAHTHGNNSSGGIGGYGIMRRSAGENLTIAATDATYGEPDIVNPPIAVSIYNATATNQNTGSGNSQNVQPTLVVNYIIKAVADLPRGGWFYQGGPNVVTQLPSNPQIGEEVYHIDNSVYLQKRYNGSSWVTLNSGGSTQPRFFVANEAGSTVSATNKATFNQVPVNEGSCWSAANNRFTAPITGSYYFHISLLNSASAPFYAEFRKNGSSMAAGTYPRGYSGTQYTANTASGIIPLNAGDYIEIWISGGTMHSYHCFLTGYLMG